MSLNIVMVQKMWYIYYSLVKNNDFMKFSCKWMEIKNIILSEVTQSQKEHTWHVLTDKWILGKNLGMPTIKQSIRRSRRPGSGGAHL